MAVPVGLQNLKMTNAAKQAIQKTNEYGLTITSAWRSSADDKRVGGTGKGYHVLGQALDSAGDRRSMDSYAKWAKESGLFRSVLWQVPDHYDHVHVSWDATDNTPIAGAGQQANSSGEGVIERFAGWLKGAFSGVTFFGEETEKSVEIFKDNQMDREEGVLSNKTWETVSTGGGFFALQVAIVAFVAFKTFGGRKKVYNIGGK
jgi:hypothetical protein